MATPITTGTKNVYGIDGVSSAASISWARQKKPFDLVLAYSARRARTTSAVLRGGTTSFGGMADPSASKSGVGSGGTPQPGTTYLRENPVVASNLEHAVNFAREKFLNEISDLEALVAVNLAERQQALDMMSNRMSQLWRWGRSLRRGRIPREWTRKSPFFRANFRKKAKTVGDTWLEYHFGWSPLVGDIYSAHEILKNPLVGKRLKVRGKRVPFEYSQVINLGGTRQSLEFSGWARCQVGATVQIVSDGMVTARQLGLINPAQVVWELVPFSFLVDWFVNVNDFLGNVTDTAGLRFVDPYHTKQVRVDRCIYDRADQPPYPYNGIRVCSEAHSIQRVLGLPSTTLKVRPLKRLSLSRALTACSLLLQQLKSSH